MLLPLTEMIPTPENCIDAISSGDALSALLAGQVAAVQAVSAALPQIEAASNLIADTLRAGGALNYVAAGSSALMALADGAELPGTFGIPQHQIRIFMAGGVPVDGKMPGDTEDDVSNSSAVVEKLGRHDLVIALSASGTTPYPCEIVKRASDKGHKIIVIANNAGSPLLSFADIAIYLPTPPEVLSGSTRLGAGTAQKVALNMMSTLAGVLLGHVHNGMMVNLNADNAKLRARAKAIVSAISGAPTAAVEQALTAARGDTKLAVLLASGCDIAVAMRLLKEHEGHLRPCLEAL
ncbi:MAG: N-acetylmuramic acid 6-phosphate etherase [Paracoccaceae bacterium]